MNRNKLKPFIPMFFSLLLALVLVILVDDFIQAVVVRPLLYVVWFSTLIYASLPQGFLWFIFILAMLILAYTNWNRLRNRRVASMAPSTGIRGPVERWTRLIEYADKAKFSKWRLAQELKRLTRTLHSPIGVPDEAGFDIDNLPLSPEIKAYFDTQQPSYPGFWEQLTQPDRETDAALDLDPETIIQYLEDKYKVP